MGKKIDIEPEKVADEADTLFSFVARRAGRAANKAIKATGEGIEWAAPKAQDALEKTISRATPIISDVAGKAQDVADKAAPVLKEFQGKVVEDYIPRINKAVTDAGEIATSDAALADRARKIRETSAKALTTPTKKQRSHRVMKAFGWTALGVTVAGAGYLLWKRSQPIEDPWAEEYWSDLDTDVDFTEVVPEKVEDAADAAKDTAKDAVDKAGDVAKDAKDKAEDAVDTVKDALDK